MTVRPLHLLLFLSVATAASFLGALAWVTSPAEFAGASGSPNSIVAPDGPGSVGLGSSLTLDAAGNPVIAYFDEQFFALKLVRCGNPNCTVNNTFASFTSPTDVVGLNASVELDGAGRPVLTHRAFLAGDLLFLHCGNAACTSGNFTAALDSADDVGYFTSLELDSADHPVVAYYDQTSGDLKVLTCQDEICASKTISAPDTGGDVGRFASLALDASGNPVVAYSDSTNGNLKVLHCGDATCSANNTITAPDTNGNVGAYASLALDSSGNPVVAYQDVSNLDLKLLHCGDPTCSTSNTITTPGSGANVGHYASLELDSSGVPVVSYFDETLTADNLIVLRCGNAVCSSGNSIVSPDGPGRVGEFPSLALDAAGNPVISYYDNTNFDLKVAHCGTPTCGPKPTATPTPTSTATPTTTPTPTTTKLPPPGDTDLDGCSDVQENGLTEEAGGRRDFKNFWDFFDVPTGTFPALARDAGVAAPDFFAVLARFGASGTATSVPDALSPAPAAPAYHAAYDRGPVQPGGDPWDLSQADGGIAGPDFFRVLGQFGHTCA